MTLNSTRLAQKIYLICGSIEASSKVEWSQLKRKQTSTAIFK